MLINHDSDTHLPTSGDPRRNPFKQWGERIFQNGMKNKLIFQAIIPIGHSRRCVICSGLNGHMFRQEGIAGVCLDFSDRYDT